MPAELYQRYISLQRGTPAQSVAPAPASCTTLPKKPPKLITSGRAAWCCVGNGEAPITQECNLEGYGAIGRHGTEERPAQHRGKDDATPPRQPPFSQNCGLPPIG